MDFTPFPTPTHTFPLSTSTTSTTSTHPPDTISIRKLHLTAQPAPDHWGRDAPQPLLLSVVLSTDITPSSTQDTLPPGSSVHYGDLTRALTHVITPGFRSEGLLRLADVVASTCFECAGGVGGVKVVGELPEGGVGCEGVGVEAVYTCERGGEGGESVVGQEGEGGGNVELVEASLFVRGLRVFCILGMNPPERTRKQCVIVSLRMWGSGSGNGGGVSGAGGEASDSAGSEAEQKSKYWYFRDYDGIVKEAVRMIESSSYQTIETLIIEIARTVCVGFGIENCTARVEKPSALTFAQAAVVEITRSREYFRGLGEI
ncbi:Dihydroneopterin aldolase-domain-containing protein [Peziza echinospora]|nr:Dihydroneopterin aldolase-domain-containing protein [Peziza echinospora]